MTTRTELPPTDVVTLMAALAIAAERFPDATEYEAMRQQILKSSSVVIETPERETVPCSSCHGHGWTGSRHDSGVYGGHYHCECGAPCAVNRSEGCSGARPVERMEQWERA